MESFLTAFDDVPDPRASNTRHDLCELLVQGSALRRDKLCRNVSLWSLKITFFQRLPEPQAFDPIA